MSDGSSPSANKRLSRTVLICAYTEARWGRLCAAVASAVGQLEERDDVLVVIDHNSALLERAVAEFSDVARVVASREEPGLSGARNTGVQEAAGDVVVFLDDDAAATAGWLGALTAPFCDPEVVGVGGAAQPDWEGGSPPWWMPEEFLWVVGCSYRGLPTEMAEVRNPIGCNMALRRDSIRRAGGFSADLGRVEDKPIGGEETDLAIRMKAAEGGKILYAPTAVVNHAVEAPRQRMSYFARRCYWEGRSKAVLARRVGASDATEAERAYLATLLSGVALRVGRIFRQRSFHPLGQIVALAFGTAATGAGFLLGSVRAKSKVRAS